MWKRGNKLKKDNLAESSVRYSAEEKLADNSEPTFFCFNG